MNKYFITLIFLLSFVFAGSAHSADINCSKVLSKGSSDIPEENFKKAYCNIKKEKFRSAKKDINKVGTELPLITDHVLYYKALTESETGNGKIAINILEKIIKTYPSSSIYKDSMILLAEIYTDEKDYDKAIKTYKKLYDKEESHWLKAKNLKAIGEIYETQNKTKNALTTFKKIWVEYPNTSFSDYVFDLADKNGLNFSPKQEDYKKRGEYFYDKNLWSLALPELNKTKKSREVIKMIGVCQYKLKRYKDSIDNLSKFESGESRYWLALAKKRQGYDIIAAQILYSIHEDFPNSEFASKGLLKAGKMFSDNLKKDNAKKAYKKLINNYSSSKEVSDGAWKLGWIYYKDKEYEKALPIFTRHNYPKDSFSTHLFKYWSAKCYEKLGDKEKANELYKSLASSPKYTYHSFLAKVKLNYEFKGNKKKTINFSKAFSNQLSKKKAEKFMDMRINELALKEIKVLEKKANSLIDNYYLSNLYYELGDYYTSIKFADEDYDSKTNYLSYPKGYEKSVKKFSKKYGLDELLVYSLIREESRFNRKAISVSKARGLMQLIPPTAREVARKVGIPNFTQQKLYLPEVNVDMGCFYVNQVMSRFKGNIPLSLAGYNAGPNRAAQWWKEMGHLPIDEFIEEIPFNETNFYVKRILRSYGAYQELYNN